MNMVISAVAALAAAGTILGSPAASGTAHADESGYLDYVATHGGSILPAPTQISRGYFICSMIRNGMPSEQVKAQDTTWDRPYVIDAAQQFLCPDTLGR
jgi:Protein of unknown function (DUF732)